MLSAYIIHLLILVGIYLILCLSLQLALGYTGLLNLGHIAFYAIGAYTSALLTLNGVPFGISFLAAGVLSLIFGYLLAFPTNKLKGDYLALATLGFTFVVYAIALNWTNLTNGSLGLAGIPKPDFFGLQISSNSQYLIFVIVIAVAVYLIMNQIVKSPFGKVLEAIRDDELAAKTLGKNTYAIKSHSLAISAFFAGIAGALYAHYITFIDPSSFDFLQIIPLLSIVIIGGIASLRGTVIATIVLVLLPEPLRFIGFPSSVIGPVRQIIYALILLLILMYRPKGFYGRVSLK